MTLKPSDGMERRSRTVAAVLALLAALLALLAFTPRTEAYIYWTNGSTDTIARADRDGSGVDPSFIGDPGGGVAVDATHIYWAHLDPAIGGIARADLDGTNVDQSFVGGIGTNDAVGVAVDAAHVYWTDTETDTIGRANLDGSGVDHFIMIEKSEFRNPDVTVDAQHVYWTNPDNDTIGRANLDGTNVDQSFITGAQGPTGIAVDANHLYWANSFTGPGAGGQGASAIGRANLDGTGVDQSFITSVGFMNEVAVDAHHVYWAREITDYGALWTYGWIARADLDGTDVDQNFLGLEGGGFSHRANGLAVDGLGNRKLAGKATAKRTQSHRGNQVRVKVTIKANEELTARASGKVKVNPTYKLKPKKVMVAAGDAKTLRLKPEKAAAKKIAKALKQGDEAKARITVTLTDLAGNSKTEKLRVRLKR